ncbi:uncharacterized protein LOC133902927 [Phragmites australis]|uniref:uncharacterized protein LOC133902927 n=1 Tax=Phragmites australis TaxID=29695 RepID=UPI002D768242|nr:uncharacterized protein LOC133902927 [Phragmites australis]
MPNTENTLSPRSRPLIIEPGGGLQAQEEKGEQRTREDDTTCQSRAFPIPGEQGVQLQGQGQCTIHTCLTKHQWVISSSVCFGLSSFTIVSSLALYWDDVLFS